MYLITDKACHIIPCHKHIKHTGDKLHIHIAFSREDIQIDGSDAEGGFKFVPGTRCYVDAVMRGKENAEKLWQLMLPTNVGGLGAFMYVCGNVAFYQTVISAMEDITVANGLPKFEVLKDMFSHHRFQCEVYKTPSKLQNPLQITSSELSKHNCVQEGFWIAMVLKTVFWV